MKAMKLSPSYQKKLLELLTLLFPGYKRIIINMKPEGVTIMFSKVNKWHILNFMPRLSNMVNSEIPFLELFQLKIPKVLSKYGYDNESFEPLYTIHVALFSKTNGDGLVKFLEDTVNEFPVKREKKDPYEVVREEVENNLSGKDNKDVTSYIFEIPKERLGGINLIDFFNRDNLG